MGILSNIFTSNASDIVSNVAKIADQFITTDSERHEFRMQMESLLQKRELEIARTVRSENKAKQEILTSELNQDDKFTKRARPMMVYFGLMIIAANHMFFPILSRLLGVETAPLPPLPVEFWAGWSGIVATWCIGRSAEKIGASNKVTRLITGQKPPEALG